MNTPPANAPVAWNEFEPHHAWPNEPARFRDHYELLASAAYPLHDPRPEKRWFGARTPRVCCLCGRSAEATFTQDCHALPAALGNRRLFTLEECDDCNGKYSAIEDDLVSLLTPQRILGRVKGRQGWPKLQPKGLSSIQAVSPSHINVFRDANDDSVTIELLDETSGKVSLRVPAFVPMRAAVAMTRSGWFLLDREQRQRAPLLIECVRGPALEGAKLFQFTTPGSPVGLTTLSVWTKKDRVVSGAEVVIQFQFYDTVLAVAVPSAGQLGPTLLPPFASLAASAGAIRRMEYILEPGARVEPSTASYQFTFGRLEKGKPGEPAEPVPRPAAQERGDRLDVLLQAGGAELASCLTIRSWEPARRSVVISGKGLPGRLSLDLSADDRNARVSLSIFAHSAPPADVHAALGFFEKVREAGELVLKLADTGEEVFRGGLGIEELPEAKLLREVVAGLALIQEKVGADIRPPRRPTKDFLETLDLVVDVLRDGVVDHGSGTLTMTVAANGRAFFEKDLPDALRKGQEVKLQAHHENVRATIESRDISLGPCDSEFIVEEVKPITMRPDGDAQVEVKVSRSTDRFPRWCERGR